MSQRTRLGGRAAAWSSRGRRQLAASLHRTRASAQRCVTATQTRAGATHRRREATPRAPSVAAPHHASRGNLRSPTRAHGVLSANLRQQRRAGMSNCGRHSSRASTCAQPRLESLRRTPERLARSQRSQRPRRKRTRRLARRMRALDSGVRPASCPLRPASFRELARDARERPAMFNETSGRDRSVRQAARRKRAGGAVCTRRHAVWRHSRRQLDDVTRIQGRLNLSVLAASSGDATCALNGSQSPCARSNSRDATARWQQANARVVHAPAPAPVRAHALGQERALPRTAGARLHEAPART